MTLIDLGTPPPPPAGLLDSLPRRVALTLAELRYVAVHAGGAPLPFDVRDGQAAPALEDRLGRSRASVEDTAYAAAVAALHDPAVSLSRRGLLVGGPDDGAVDEGLVGAVGLLATPTLALDLDVAAGTAQAKSWHRQSGDAVAALSTCDGIVFELAWFPTSIWTTELARVAVLPEDLARSDSSVPAFVDLPYELADAAGEAVRSSRADLVPVLVGQHSGLSTDETGAALGDADTATLLMAFAAEARGRLRVLVADVSGGETTTVGVVSWTLLADGWRSLRPHQVDEELHVQIRSVGPDELATELAPVLAAVTTGVTP